MHVELACAAEHLLRRAVGVGFGEGFAARPSDEVVHRTPPRFNLVKTLGFRIINESARVVIEPHGARSMDFVADESRRLVDQVDAVAETVFEIDLMALATGMRLVTTIIEIVLSKDAVH